MLTKNLTLERIASGRAVLWSCPFWALVAPCALDELLDQRVATLPVALSLQVVVCLVLALLSYALLRPLMRAARKPLSKSNRRAKLDNSRSMARLLSSHEIHPARPR